MLSKFTIYRKVNAGVNERKEPEIIISDTANSFEALVENALKAGMDLSGAKLEYINLHHFSCSGAQLANANLIGANFVYADFERANLRGATLVAANLAWADFSQSDFSGGSLVATNLAMACLNNCNFEGASLEGANLWGIRIYSGKWTAELLYNQLRSRPGDR